MPEPFSLNVVGEVTKDEILKCGKDLSSLLPFQARCRAGELRAVFSAFSRKAGAGPFRIKAKIFGDKVDFKFYELLDSGPLLVFENSIAYVD